MEKVPKMKWGSAIDEFYQNLEDLYGFLKLNMSRSSVVQQPRAPWVTPVLHVKSLLTCFQIMVFGVHGRLQHPAVDPHLMPLKLERANVCIPESQLMDALGATLL